MVRSTQKAIHLFSKEKQNNMQQNHILVTKRDESLYDSIFSGQPPIPEKLSQQNQLSYMRSELELDRLHLNITYPVNPPFAFVKILFDQEKGEYHYLISEPDLTGKEEEQLQFIKEKVESTMDREELPIEEGFTFASSSKLSAYLRKRFDKVIELFDLPISEERRPILFYYMERELIGLGRSDSVIRDPYVEDIGCNGPKIPLYLFHRVFGSMKTNIKYPTELELNRFILKLAQTSGKHISIYQPILDAVLSDGSRINLTLGSEVTRKGSTFTIRKFSYDPISPIDLLRFSSIDPLMLSYYWLLIQHKKSLLMSGGTASGKTTMLNAICMFIRPEDKIVSIEDTPEIHIDHENWIQSVSRKGYGKASGISGISGISGMSGISGVGGAGSVDMFDLLVAALRQRPEYIIVGEIRGREAFTLFQAIAVGHASMSTVHAGTIEELLHRVENEPMNIPRVLFTSIDAVGLMGQVNYKGKRARRTKSIVEVLDLESDTNNVLTNNPFRWNPKDDTFSYSGRSFVLETIAEEIGSSIKDMTDELEQRRQFLSLMDEKNVTYYKEVERAIAMYYVDADNAFDELHRRPVVT
ncbi:MAG: type II/IV secretion system ATPase subunit [Candidatus Thermoplasmatota archaeon]|nr:type II/IV secretion system ATPase subunit [Candidatus Thermoplasmatota archaeon]